MMASRKGWAAYLLVGLIAGLGVLSPASPMSAAVQASHPVGPAPIPMRAVQSIHLTNHFSDIDSLAAVDGGGSTDVVTNIGQSHIN